MLYTLKRLMYYSTLPILAGLHCQTTYAGQMLSLQTSETEFAQGIEQAQKRAYHVFHHGKEISPSDLAAPQIPVFSQPSTLPTEKLVPIADRIHGLAEQIVQLTKAMEVRSEFIEMTTGQIIFTSDQLQSISKQIDDLSSQIVPLQSKLKQLTGKKNRKARKRIYDQLTPLTSSQETFVEKRRVLAKQLEDLLSSKQALKKEQNNDAVQRELVKDNKKCAQVSEQFGSYSYSSKSSSESATWKQMFGAIPEGLTQLGATLVRPFTDKMPGWSDVVDIAKNQREKINQEGVYHYAQDIASAGVGLVGAGVRTVIENPLDTLVLSTSIALGHLHIAEGSLLPSLAWAGNTARMAEPLVYYAIEIAPKLKEAIGEESKKIEAEGLANYLLTRGTHLGTTTREFIESDTFKFLAAGTFAVGAVYVAGQMLNLPGANAQYTPVLGTQYKINQNNVKAGVDTVCLPNEACVTGWADNSNNMIARIHIPKNGTFVTTELPISTSASTVTSAQELQPCLGAFSNGNWFMTWLQSQSTLNYRIFTSTGSSVISPTQVNSPGETFVNPPSCVGSSTRGYIGWANSTAGTYKDLFVTFGSDGTGLSAPVLLQQSASVLGGSRVTTYANGNFYALYGGAGLQASEITPTGSIGSPTTITLSPALAIIDPTGLVGGSGKDALLLGIDGGGTNLKGIAIPNGIPSSSQFTVHSSAVNFCCASAAGLIDGTALTAIQTGDAIGTPIINGTLLSSTGSLLSQEFTISAPTLNGLGGPVVTRIPTGGASVTMGDGLGAIYERMVTFTAPPTTTSSPTTSGSPTTPTTTGVPTTSSPSSTTGPTTPTTTGVPTTASPSGTTTPSSTTAPTSSGSNLRPGMASALVGGLSALAALYWG